MKLKTKIIAGAALLAFLTFAAGSLRADNVTNVLTINATVMTQGNTNDNGTVTTIAAPIKESVETKQVLEFLAVDENAEGNYPSNSFPTGAKLVVIGDSDFQVLNKSNKFLVDVSGVLSVQDVNEGTNDMISGKVINETGLADTTLTDLHVLKFIYDDSAVSGGVGLQFYLEGLMTSTVTDTAPKAGKYTETKSNKITSALGEGNFQGTPFVITGSLTADGKATIAL